MNNNQRHKKLSLYCLLYLVCGLISSPSWAETQKVDDVQTITHGMSLAKSCEQALLVLDKRYASATLNNDAFICMAYLNGVMAATQHANEHAKLAFSLATEGRGNQAAFNIYCFDWEHSFQKIAAIVLTFAQQNPEYLQRPADKMVMRALQTAFPCR